MNIRQLKIFLNVAKSLNVTKTADDMFLAQPSVSLAIKELESEYNIKLFKRIKQRLILTEEGKELMLYAKQIINDVTLFEIKANNLSIKPKLNIACSLSVGENNLAKAIYNYRFKDKFNLHFNILISSKIIDGIANGDFDFGIIESEVNDDSINKIKIKEDELIVIASNDYKINNKITIKELIKEPLILRENLSGTRLYVDNIFKNKQIKVEPFCEASTNQSLLDFVKHNLGLGILPKIAVKSYLDSNLIKEIKVNDLNLKRNIYLIYLKNRILNQDEINLKEYLIKNI